MFKKKKNRLKKKESRVQRLPCTGLLPLPLPVLISDYRFAKLCFVFPASNKFRFPFPPGVNRYVTRSSLTSAVITIFHRPRIPTFNLSNKILIDREGSLWWWSTAIFLSAGGRFSNESSGVFLTTNKWSSGASNFKRSR